MVQNLPIRLRQLFHDLEVGRDPALFESFMSRVFKLAQLKRESQFLINLLRAAQCVADEVEMCLSSICLHVTVSLFTKFDFIAFQIYCMEVVRGF